MNTELEDIIQIIKKAGQKVMEIYGREYKTHQKSDKSLVTEADFASQKIILEGLSKYNYGILSEEQRDDTSRLRKEKVWIVDPLDGTKDYLKKTGDFAIMIGLASDREPILGAVYQPIKDKLYFAEKGKGAFLKESDKSQKKLKVSNVSGFSGSRFVVSRFHLIEPEKDFLENNKIRKVIRAGSTGVKIGMIAEHQAEGYINLSQKTCQWDTCAPEIILKEAGGQVTDRNGENYVYNRKELRNLNGLVVSNGKIHPEIIEKLANLNH